jgi:hypothetical protein
MYYAGKKPKKPKPVPPPKPIPVQDVQATDTSARTAEALRRRAGGVASTALTETLGG